MNTADLNYHHLRLFWELARCGSLRVAAERLHLSQPTISAQVRALEESLGESLFDRTGRGLKLTATGRQVMDCAGEIFELGSNLVRSLSGTTGSRNLRLNLGVTQSLPKLVTWRLVRLALRDLPNLRFACHEGTVPELVGQLVSGRLDLVLADEPAPRTLRTRTFDRLIDESPVIFCATPALARGLKKGFPESLDDAPALLPSQHTAWRHELDRWFESRRLNPRIIGEFDDAALMKTAAADGLGFVPIPASVLEDAVTRYGLEAVGSRVQCRFRCHVIALERSQRHPALDIITQASGQDGTGAPGRKRARTKPGLA